MDKKQSKLSLGYCIGVFRVLSGTKVSKDFFRKFLRRLAVCLAYCLIEYVFDDEADREGGGKISQEGLLRIMKKTSLY